MKNAFTVHTFSNSKLTMLSLIPTKLAMEIPKPMLNQHLVFVPKIEFICVGYTIRRLRPRRHLPTETRTGFTVSP